MHFSAAFFKNIDFVFCVFLQLSGYELSPSAAANFTRKNLAEYLRSRVITMTHEKLRLYNFYSSEDSV